MVAVQEKTKGKHILVKTVRKIWIKGKELEIVKRVKIKARIFIRIKQQQHLVVLCNDSIFIISNINGINRFYFLELK